MRTFIQNKLTTTSTTKLVAITTIITFLLSTILTIITSFIMLGEFSPEMLMANSAISVIIPVIVAPFMINLLKTATTWEQANQQLKVENIERKRMAKEASQRANAMQSISQLAIECATASPDEDIIKLIADNLRNITDALGVGITIYDSKERTLTTKHIAVSDQVLTIANKLVGYNLIGMVNHVPPATEKHMLSGTVDTFSDLSEVSFGAVPKSVAKLIKSTIGIGAFTGLALSSAGKLIGTAIIAHKDGQPMLDLDVCKTLAHVSAVSIQRKNAENALREAEKDRENLITELKEKNTELEQFTYTVSHDLKAPLITIKGFLGLLEKDILDDQLDRAKRDLFRISDATEKMHQLLNELLQLSRIGRFVNPSQEISFEMVIQDASMAVRGRLDKHNVKINIANNLPSVCVDRTRLVQVMQNLLDNAAKFMGEQTNPLVEIGIDGKDTDGKRIFFVKDNGKGIAPDQLERVFGLFQKLDANGDGTGIGLALVKRIIEVHGGQVWIESPGIDKGTTVFFSLPVS